MRLIYALYYAWLFRRDCPRAEARDLAAQEVSRTLDASPPDFVRLKRLLTIGTNLGVIAGFAVFVTGLVARLISGSMVPLNIALVLGALPWSMGALQGIRLLFVPIQTRVWRGRGNPLPFMFRPSWIDVLVGAVLGCLLAFGAMARP